ncbi:hypothetical protein C5S32_02630 [ANME-1 cluster archaeon GoMg1]|nr:hypothetical protein [ANME-1 cluster archaeon GoMg1]
MQKRKKILASVSVLLVALLVGAIVTNAVPAPMIEPIPIRPVPPPPPGEKGIYAKIIPYDNLAKAGETIVVEGKVHNDGNSEITVELVPIMREKEEYWYKYSENVIKPEWVSVNPSEINLGAQESASFDISVSIPSDVESGYYSGMIAIRTDKYPERIEHYSVQVYKPLEEPIVTEFRVAPNSSKMVVTVKWNNDEKNLISAEGTVDVHLFDPYGNETSQQTKVMTHISGYVNVFEYAFRPLPPESISMPVVKSEEETTKTNVHEHGQQAVIYRIENPASGTWKLEMKPEDVMQFNYDIVVNPIENVKI